jgi:murein DD-endopeptidase MepM/ murein hydrolase activator NlpD
VPADGRYRVMAGQRGHTLRGAGSFVLHGHFYPVRGPHWFRGAVGRFGVPRSGGRTHEGFDVLAACGTPVASARAGRVTRRRYDPVLYGNYVIVRSSRERRSYMYAHLAHPARVRVGLHIRTGRRIGRVGATGNARTQGCQLHFEAIGPDGPFDPESRLRAWDRWS